MTAPGRGRAWERERKSCDGEFVRCSQRLLQARIRVVFSSRHPLSFGGPIGRIICRKIEVLCLFQEKAKEGKVLCLLQEEAQGVWVLCLIGLDNHTTESLLKVLKERKLAKDAQNLNENLTFNRTQWRKRIHVADPT
ncbi:hypothetical protein IEQ34_018036 [Dendrobium chrysotoxum]|uniref:Uncharacterized protein n=1 Tax=Dendrobium chrysotoxum TaxID=161865 RepID=A0AAV7GD37_DENCH|nr:hypothetical protein IEQ34_018036 [Dendrobium chrysotoxum]